MDEESFVRALDKALSNDILLKKITSGFTFELRQEMSALRAVLQQKDQKIKELESRVQQLENDQDVLEQYTRRNSLRVSGLPEDRHEDPAEVVLKVFNKTMGLEKTGNPILITDIDRVHRVGKPQEGKSRQILVKFATYRARQRVFGAKRNLKPGTSPPQRVDADKPVPRTPMADQPTDATNTGPDPVVTPNSTIQQSIYLSEDLTAARASLLFHARKANNLNKINGCWSSDGTILVKNKANRIIPIKNLQDLANLSSDA